MRNFLSPNGEWSDEELSQRLNALAMSTLRTARRAPEQFSGELEAGLKELREAFTAPPLRWESIFPVVGFYRECLPYRFGAIAFQEGESLADELLPNGEPCDPPHGELDVYALGILKKDIRSTFAATIIARTTCLAADKAAAAALNLRELLATLDVVNFYGDVYRPAAYRAHVLIASEVPDGELNSITREYGVPFRRGGGNRRTGRFDDVWLPSLDGADAAEFGLDKANELLTMQPRTEVAKRILSAMQWAGRATIERRSEQAFLDYAIALEGLLLGAAKDADITFRLKVRAAHLAVHANIASRRTYADEVAQLYDIRSKIVHQGLTNVDWSEVNRMREFTKGCIITSLKQPDLLALKSSKELDSWFDDKIYAGG